MKKKKTMSSYFEKLSEYYKSEKAEKDNERFVKQVKNSFVSTAIIIGIVFFLIAAIIVISAFSSIFG